MSLKDHFAPALLIAATTTTATLTTIARLSDDPVAKTATVYFDCMTKLGGGIYVNPLVDTCTTNENIIKKVKEEIARAVK